MEKEIKYNCQKCSTLLVEEIKNSTMCVNEEGVIATLNRNIYPRSLNIMDMSIHVNTLAEFKADRSNTEVITTLDVICQECGYNNTQLVKLA